MNVDRAKKKTKNKKKQRGSRERGWSDHRGQAMHVRRSRGTSLVVQGLRLWAPQCRGPGFDPGQGTRSHMPQLRVCMAQLKIPHATRETQDPMRRPKSCVLQLRPIKAKEINDFFFLSCSRELGGWGVQTAAGEAAQGSAHPCWPT